MEVFLQELHDLLNKLQAAVDRETIEKRKWRQFDFYWCEILIALQITEARYPKWDVREIWVPAMQAFLDGFEMTKGHVVFMPSLERRRRPHI